MPVQGKIDNVPHLVEPPPSAAHPALAPGSDLPTNCRLLKA